MAEDQSRPPERLRGFLESGGPVVGSVVGVAISVVMGPVLGAGAGAAIGEALSRVGTEFYDRVLAPRQAARAGGALSVAVARIGERLSAGEELREDGFFDPGPDGRADADEVLEGTLLTAANAWEERKVAPLGRMYANLAFDASIAPGWANYLLRVVDGLTYTQLLLLAFVDEADRGGEYERVVVNLSSVASEVRREPDATLYAQLDGLSTAQLVGIRQQSGAPVPPAETFGGGRWFPSSIVNASLMPTGRVLHDLMELNVLPREELDALVDGIRGDRDP